MSDFVAVARVEDIPPGTGRQVTVGDTPVAVFNLDGEFHALEGSCLHRGGPIGDGDVEDGIVTCPWHGYQYDVCTGRLTMDPRVGLTVHRTRVSDGVVEVSLG